MFIAIYGGSIEKAVPLPVLPILVTGEALPVVSPPALSVYFKGCITSLNCAMVYPTHPEYPPSPFPT